MGLKAEKDFGNNFFWVLGGVPKPGQDAGFEYYVIPSSVMAENVLTAHQLWLKTPGKNGRPHKENKVRSVHLPPFKSFRGWDISRYRDRWDLIETKLA